MGDSAGPGEGEVWEPLAPGAVAWPHTWGTLLARSKLDFLVCEVAMSIPAPAARVAGGIK